MDIVYRKVKLPFPMRSLDKVKTFEELCLWFDKVGIGPNDDVVITPKYDGISLLCNENDWMTYSRGGNDNEGIFICQAILFSCNFLHFGIYFFKKS